MDIDAKIIVDDVSSLNDSILEPTDLKPEPPLEPLEQHPPSPETQAAELILFDSISEHHALEHVAYEHCVDAASEAGGQELKNDGMEPVQENESNHHVLLEQNHVLESVKMPFKDSVRQPESVKKVGRRGMSFIKGQSAGKKNGLVGDAMQDGKVFQSAYLAFGRLLQSFQLDGLDKAMEHDFPEALKWFKISYSESPANGPWNLYVRIYVFHCLKSILQDLKKLIPKPQNLDQVQKIIITCLGMEPLNELIFTMMVDISVWLREYEGKMIMDSETDLSQLEYFIGSWECILEMPFETPDSVVVNHISTVLNNIRSRSDVYSIISNTLDHLFNRVIWIRNQPDNNLLEDVGLKALKKKIEWILHFVEGALKKNSPSVSCASGLLEVCLRILDEQDDDPFSGVLDAARELKLELASFLEKLCSQSLDMPPIAYSEKKPPYIFELLNLKKHAAMNNNAMLPNQSKVTDSNESLDLRSVPYSNADLLVSIDAILFQVDPILERLVNDEDDKTAQAPIFISPNPGRFIITKHEMFFMGRPITNTAFDYDPSSLSLALKIDHSDVKLICQAALGSSSLDISEEEPEEVPISRRKSTVSSLIRRRSKASFAKPKKMPSGGNQAIIIETSSEVYKFFPFTAAEANTIANCISEISGVPPTPLGDYISHIAFNIKTRDRQTALQNLSKESNPWIETSEALTECISSLAKESSEFSFDTLERLFHSCRLEKKVAFETISCLKEFMSSASSEAAILKILIILDRILDKSIMTPGDMLFPSVLHWLKECQETISPFKNPKAVKTLDNLLKRCKSFSIEPLIPLGENADFDYQHDYEFWRMFYDS